MSLDDWDPGHFMRTDTSAASPEKLPVQAYYVTPQPRLVDQAILEPQHLHDDIVQVRLRLADTKLWFNAGIVPLRYP